MTDGADAGATPAATGGASPQDTGTGTGTPTGTTLAPDGSDAGATPAPDGATPVREPSDGALEEARQEAIAERKKRQELETELRKRDEATMSESEKTAQRLAAAEQRSSSLEAELQQLRLERGVRDIAAESGALYPEKAWRLVRLSELNYDDNGNPTNLKSLVNKAVEEFPELFRQPPRPFGSADGGPRPAAPSREPAPGADRLRYAHETGQGTRTGR